MTADPGVAGSPSGSDPSGVCLRTEHLFRESLSPITGQGFIATAMGSIMHRKPVKIFGQRGTVRDYIYVSDLAAGILDALEKGRFSETYNLGSGVGRSNMDVIEAISPLMKKAGDDIRVENLPERAFDVKANVLDSNKLQKDTGWKPQFEFGEGLLRTFAWLRRFYG
jgi:UDP-glucose 4-epimerase